MQLNLIISMLILLISLLDITTGLYIKTIDEEAKNPAQHETGKDAISDDEWTAFKNKLGLTDEKVELLKSQKNQKATADLLKKFIKENPKYITVPTKTTTDSDAFHNVFHGLLKQLQASKGTLKASLNFELADKSQKPLKRAPRKIAVKMVSDIPSEKIDDLLKMFNQQHGLNEEDEDDEDNEESNDEADHNTLDYNDLSAPITTDSDYMYENLWEDEEVPSALDSPQKNSQYGSFKDLIMQASRQRWQREMDEAKLNSKHFV